MPQLRSVPGAPRVQEAIRQAAHRTRTDFGFLMAQARVESALDPSAKASTSSAAGLFQFTQGTWLDTVKKHGAAHGLAWAAEAIDRRGGRNAIADPGMRERIMGLRFDPHVASLMAGEFANDNAATLSGAIGRAPDETELYLSHFLGAGGAIRFIRSHAVDPGQDAAALFPEAAGANRPVFYRGGQARSLSEVRALFADKLAAASPDDSSFSEVATFSLTAGSWSGDRHLSPAIAASSAPPRQSMADTLTGAFSATGMGAAPPAHIANAYAVIRRMGM